VDVEIDRALLQGRKKVHVIHGRGTGALRAGVQRHLSDHPLVERFADAGLHEGGAGTTVVELRG
jgi:DNA mismatch repair protein MutS2